MFKQVLVPLDGTPDAAAALPLAQLIARAAGARITLVRVVPIWLCPDDPALAGVRAELGAVAAGLAEAGLAVEAAVRRVTREQDIPAEILGAAAAAAADLVVMATHARSGLALLARGSVAERVLERSAAPVLLLRTGDAAPEDRRTGRTGAPAPVPPRAGDAAGTATAKLDRILVPVDGTPEGCAALDTAASLAVATGGELFLLRVVVPTPRQGYDPLLGAYAGVEVELQYDREALDNAQRYVDGLAARLQATGVAAQARAMFGGVTGAILETADRIGADSIAMSTHALTQPARAVLGSVAHAVVRLSGRPVLLARRMAGGRGRSICRDVATVAATPGGAPGRH